MLITCHPRNSFSVCLGLQLSFLIGVVHAASTLPHWTLYVLQQETLIPVTEGSAVFYLGSDLKINSPQRRNTDFIHALASSYSRAPLMALLGPRNITVEKEICPL